MEKEDTKFKVVDNMGNEKEYEKLFSFESDKTKKSYIIYTDNELDEDGNTKVYASIYEPDKETQSLQAVETEEEWKIIESILKSLTEEKES